MLHFVQEKIGKRYLVNHRLDPAAILGTRAPQNYGFDSLSELVALYQNNEKINAQMETKEFSNKYETTKNRDVETKISVLRSNL